MKKNYTTLVFLFFLVFMTKIFAQNPTQTIRGTVSDKQSFSPIPGVNVIIIGSNPVKVGSTDIDGKFKIMEVNPGRYDLKVTYLGYKEIVLPKVVVTSGKEIVLEIGMEENINSTMILNSGSISNLATNYSIFLGLKNKHVTLL